MERLKRFLALLISCFLFSGCLWSDMFKLPEHRQENIGPLVPQIVYRDRYHTQTIIKEPPAQKEAKLRSKSEDCSKYEIFEKDLCEARQKLIKEKEDEQKKNYDIRDGQFLIDLGNLSKHSDQEIYCLWNECKIVAHNFQALDKELARRIKKHGKMRIKKSEEFKKTSRWFQYPINWGWFSKK